MYLGRIVEKQEIDALSANAENPYTHAPIAFVPTREPRPSVPDAHLGVEFPSPIDPPSGWTFYTSRRHATDVCGQRAPRRIARSSDAFVGRRIHGEMQPVSLKSGAA